MTAPTDQEHAAAPKLSRAEWWREYAAWDLGERDGPPCGRCGATIPREQLLPPHTGLCPSCEQGERSDQTNDRPMTEPNLPEMWSRLDAGIEAIRVTKALREAVRALEAIAERSGPARDIAALAINRVETELTANVALDNEDDPE